MTMAAGAGKGAIQVFINKIHIHKASNACEICLTYNILGLTAATGGLLDPNFCLMDSGAPGRNDQQNSI